MISPLGALQAICHDGFWKIDRDFLIAFYVTFYLGCMVSEIMNEEMYIANSNGPRTLP